MGSTSDIIRSTLAVVNPVTAVQTELGLGGARTKAGIDSKKQDARNAVDEAKKQANKLAADAELRRTNQEGAATAAATADAARKRQLAIAASNQGRRSTILTGPLGLLNDATTARKTILGA